MTGTSSIDHLALLHRIDDLYRGVVTDPQGWTDSAFAEWASDLAPEATSVKPVARAVRRSLRAAVKLRTFWLAAGLPPEEAAASEDWRSRVDRALGPSAWRPTLDLAMSGLTAAPSRELFDEVRARFRVVHSDRWMEGVSFEEWVEGWSPPTGS